MRIQMSRTATVIDQGLVRKPVSAPVGAAETAER
jgi:hypothetical protein